MIRILARLALNLLANGVGLLAASVLLDDFAIDITSFITAVIIFSVAVTILGPLTTKVALTSAPYLMGGIALVTILVGLIITNAVSNGVTISGLSTWVLATLIIWIFSLVANLLLPLVLFKKALANHAEQNK